MNERNPRDERPHGSEKCVLESQCGRSRGAKVRTYPKAQVPRTPRTRPAAARQSS